VSEYELRNSDAPDKDRLRALRLVPVSHETAERFDIFVNLLARWRSKSNLVSEATFRTVWTRHIADSAQLLLVTSGIIRWADMGSGGGFPGMVLAMQLADVDGAVVHCVESDQRKCAFLREVARATCAPAIVHSARIQSINPSVLGIVDGITARAFAPLSITLEMARSWLAAGAVGVFPRGRSVTKQLASLHFRPDYEFDIVSSVVDAAAAILRVRFNWGAANGSHPQARILQGAPPETAGACHGEPEGWRRKDHHRD
jgi:16S rRNA (guanine527-N7)-methyltransferase